MRDREVRDFILETEFRHLTVWECTLRGKTRRDHGDLRRRRVVWVDVAEAERDDLHHDTDGNTPTYALRH